MSPIDRDFVFARRLFRQKFNGDRKLAIRECKHFAKATINRLFNDEIPDNEFLGPVRRKIIELSPINPSSRLYLSLSELIQTGDNETAKLQHYNGRYRYFRKTTRGPHAVGTIDIYSKDGICLFSHNNEIVTSKFPMPSPDHEGLVFQLGPRLHLLGIGPRYIRPIVAYECLQLRQEPVHGFVIATTEQSRGAHLFAARFVMFHQSHPKSKLKLPDKDIIAILEESIGQRGILTL